MAWEKPYDHRLLDRDHEARLAADVTFEQVARALLAQPYRFAKTMPQCPHEYCLRKTWDAEIPFDNVVAYIRRHGYESTYKSAYRQYFNLNGQQYWTMNFPTDQTILINRAVPSVREYPATYDKIAETYDSLYADVACQEEERAVFDHISDMPGSLLDIGCGTGVVFEWCHPERYVGIDPSAHMLAQVRAKYGERSSEELIRCALHEFHTDEKFDHVLALFGVGSYLTEEQVRRIPTFCKPGGRYVFMWYRPSYTPKTADYGDDLDIHDHPVDILPGELGTIGGHYIIRGSAP